MICRFEAFEGCHSELITNPFAHLDVHDLEALCTLEQDACLPCIDLPYSL